MKALSQQLYEKHLAWDLRSYLRRPLHRFGIVVVTLNDTLGANAVINDIISQLDERCLPILLTGPTFPLQLKLPRRKRRDVQVAWVTATSGSPSKLEFPILSPYDLTGIGMFLADVLGGAPKGVKPVIVGDFFDNLLPHIDVGKLSAFISSLASLIRSRNYTGVFLTSSDSHDRAKLSILKRFADVIVDLLDVDVEGRLERRVRVLDKVHNVQTYWTVSEQKHATSIERMVVKSGRRVVKTLRKAASSNWAKRSAAHVRWFVYTARTSLFALGSAAMSTVSRLAELAASTGTLATQLSRVRPADLDSALRLGASAWTSSKIGVMKGLGAIPALRWHPNLLSPRRIRSKIEMMKGKLFGELLKACDWIVRIGLDLHEQIAWEVVQKIASGRVLEVGARFGALPLYAALKLGRGDVRKSLGSEPTSERHVSFATLNEEGPEIEDATYDLIVVPRGLQSLNVSRQTLAKFAKALKPGGELWIYQTRWDALQDRSSVVAAAHKGPIGFAVRLLARSRLPTLCLQVHRFHDARLLSGARQTGFGRLRVERSSFWDKIRLVKRHS